MLNVYIIVYSAEKINKIPLKNFPEAKICREDKFFPGKGRHFSFWRERNGGGRRIKRRALAWLAALWVLILAAAVRFYRLSRTAGYLMVPYLVWTAFAGYLNFGVYLNSPLRFEREATLLAQ